MKKLLLSLLALTFVALPQVKADCSAVTPPYIEDFESESYTTGTAAGTIPDCWTMPLLHISATSTLNYPYVNNGTAFATSGAKSLYFGSTNSTYLKDSLFYFALPEMNADISTLQLSFNLRCGAASYATDSLLVGVMTDPTDTSTFTLVYTVYTTGANVYTEYVCPLDAYTGAGKYIAVWRPIGLTHYYYIDDVTVKKIPSCYEPKNLQASDVTRNSAKLTWSQNKLAKTSATAWNVAAVMRGEDISTATIIPVKDTVYTFTGLKASKDYTLYVQTDCGSGDVSEWATTTITTDFFLELEDAHWNFDDPADMYQIDPSSTTYPLAKGWTSGNKYTSVKSYYPYLRKNVVVVSTGVQTSTYSQSGDYALGIHSTYSVNQYSTTDAIPAWTMLPEINANLDSLQISFDIRAIYHNASTGALTKTNQGSTYAHAIKVGTFEDDEDYTTFQLLGEYVVPVVDGSSIDDDLTGRDFWNKVELPLTGAKGKRIVFFSDYNKGTSNFSNIVYIDNVVVSKQNATVAAMITGFGAVDSLITMSSATMVWASNATKWQVKLYNEANELVETQEVTEKKVDFKNLSSNTLYTAKIASVLSDGTLGIEETAQFRTECAPIAVGDVLNFDNANNKHFLPNTTSAGYEIDYCWDAQSNYSTVTSRYLYSPTVKANTSSDHYSYSGEYALQMYSTKTAAGWAVLPAVSGDLEKLQLVFKARGTYQKVSTGKLYATYLNSNYKHGIKVGRMSDPTDKSTFETISEFVYAIPASDDANADNDYLWQTVTVPLGGFKGEYVVFMSDYTDFSNYMYIDDIHFEVAPSCVVPVGSELKDITDTTATVAWKSAAKMFEVKLMQNDSVLETRVVNTTSYKFAGLTPLTTYSFQARTICESDTTDWSSAFIFKTECPSKFAVPYLVTFDEYNSGAGNMVDCWTTLCSYSTSSLAANSYPYVYSSASYEGARGLYLVNYQANPSYAILPEFDSDINKLMLSFMYKSNASAAATPNRYAVIGVADSIETIEELERTFVVLDSIVSSSTEWSAYALGFNSYTGKGKHIVLKGWNGNGSTSVGGLYVDNLKVEEVPSCVTPINIVASSTATTATVAWERNAAELTESKAWDIKIGDSTYVATDLKYTIESLKPSTEYTIYIRTNCGDGDVSAWDSINVATKCLVEYGDTTTWNFEDNLVATTSATYSIPECWEVGTFGTTSQVYAPYVYANTTTYNYAHGTEATTGKALRFYTTASYGPAYAVLPQTSSDMKNMELSFWGRAAYSYTSTYSTATYHNRMYNNSSYTKTLVLGVIENPEDTSTFTPIDTLEYPYTFTSSSPYSYSTDDETGNNYWVEYKVDLSKYVGGQIVIMYPKGTATSYFYIDDMKIEKLVKCQDTTVYTSVLVQAGETYQFAGQTLTESGVYTDSLKSVEGCDSVVVLTLTVCQPLAEILDVTVQAGETYQFAGQTLTESGVYTDTLVNALGCDSVVTLNLLVCQPLAETLEVTVQAGETYQFAGQTLTESGVYTDTLVNALGCDSVVTLNLLVCQPLAETLEVTVQAGDTYQFAGQTLTESGVYTDTLVNALGCDSVVTLNLTVCEALFDSVVAVIDLGDAYLFGGDSLTQTGIYIDTLVNAQGCDSVVVLALVVCEPTVDSIAVSIVTGEKYEFAGIELTESGVYYDTLTTEQGCETVIVLTLDVTTGWFNQSATTVQVAPNPVTVGQAINVIASTDLTDAEATIYDVNGKLVRKEILTNNQISGLATEGMYLLRIVSNNAVYETKIVVR